MRRKFLIATIAILVTVLIGAYIAYPWFEIRLLTSHQQSITKEIAAWGETYSNIQGADDAGRAAEIVEYIRNYYVVGPGYSSDVKTDAALENQRRETIGRINAALQEYKESSESND